NGDGRNRNAMAVLWWCSRVQWGLESWRLEVGAPGGFSGPGGGGGAAVEDGAMGKFIQAWPWPVDGGINGGY
ncbi:hypothetical protein V501_07446, partial [Pseudogymnoascus sp. VKM F-4519 (FW-2642)]